MVRALTYLLVLLVHSDILEAGPRENSRYLQSQSGTNHWGTVLGTEGTEGRGGRSSTDRLERRKLERKQLRQNTRAAQESQQQAAPLTTTTTTSATTVRERTPVRTTTTTERVRKIEDNDFPLMKNRELSSPKFARKNDEEVDKFLSIPDLDSPPEHKRFQAKDMPVLERRKVSKHSSGLQSERINWRKKLRKEKRKMLGGFGGDRGGGGEPEVSFNANFGTKKGDKNLMNTKLSQFVPSFSNSKHKGKMNKRKEFKMTEKKWKNHSDSKEEGKPSSVRERIELRKAKRNQVRKNKAGSKKKFPKFPNNLKDLRKQKRKENRQENKEFSKLSQSLTPSKGKQNHQQPQLTDYPEVRTKECDGMMVMV